MAASKKGPKNKVPSKKYKKYKVKEGKVERSRYCPRCGEGTFMAAHANRDYCGLCHYTEFKSK